MVKTITHQDSGTYFGDEKHLEASQTRSFGEMIFELLCEKMPSEKELALFELILNLSIDHGPDAPSAVATIQAAKEGKTISQALAAGISQINSTHGGAIEPAMEILYSINNEQLTINKLVEEYIKKEKKIPGLGHRVYKDEDPRTKLIFSKLQEADMGEEFINLEQELQQEFEKQSGKHLPINIDGAIAVVLCTFGWPSKLSKAVFIIARTPGLCGQFINHLVI